MIEVSTGLWEFGLSQLFDDDLAQLAAGLTLYDALYLWCRDGTQETHNWPAKTV